MDHLQQRRLRRNPLTPSPVLWIALAFAASCIAASSASTCTAQAAPSPAVQTPPSRSPLVIQPSLALRGVHLGNAVLRQEQNQTVLYVTPHAKGAEKVPLTYPSKYPHSIVGPFGARVIAETPHGFLIFTDSFASNPGNIQGQCGASDTGERFLHVVSFAQPPRETFSAIIESCLLDIAPSPRSPSYNPAAHTLTLRLHQEDSTTTLILTIEPTGTVNKAAK